MRKIHTLKLFDAETIIAGGDTESNVLDLDFDYHAAGYFSFQIALTGDGTAKIEYLLSNDGVNYLEPSSAADIVLAHTKVSGPGTDGKDIYSFQPEIARYMKIKITETGAADAITVTGFIAIQADH